MTEPDALQRLVDLAVLARVPPETIEVKIFESAGTSFHPKAYIMYLPDNEGVAFVGSSNLSPVALGDGIEWNYRVIPARDRAGFRAVVEAFDRLFRHPRTRRLDTRWVGAYRTRRPTERARPLEIAPEPLAPPEPHEVQREALQALEVTRAEGNAAALVVLATGLGKTWLAAFDSARPEFRKVLFVAHREEILGQALATFRRIRPTAGWGSTRARSRRSTRTSSSPRSRPSGRRDTSTSSRQARSITWSSTSSTTRRRRPIED